MALECECFPLDDPRVIDIHIAKQKNTGPRYCTDTKKPGLADIDLCEIQRRSQDKRNKHNDYSCHLKGEKRQNLINKMKMFLDDYDDRPVMNRGSKSGKGGGRALGQTGFGPLIKYPGYVDYDHPYFSEPYNSLPTLALTVNQQPGGNPCPPISVRNWEETRKQSQNQTQSHHTQSQGGAARAKGCHCAQWRGEAARCPAANS